MGEQRKSFPEFYVTAPTTCPYLPGHFERKLFTHLTHEKPAGLVDSLLKGGFRRSQSIAYMPYCDGCTACVSVRVIVPDFEPKRSFRRVLDLNRDIETRRGTPRPTAEQYALFRDYIDARHGDGGMADMTVLDFAMMIEDSILDTTLTEYRVESRGEVSAGASPAASTLQGVALCDRLSDGLSLVYSFFDPAVPKRSLGTLMILDHIEYARALGLRYLYLGYWIAGSRKMAYKSRFEPLERLGPEGWVRMPAVGDNSSAQLPR